MPKRIPTSKRVAVITLGCKVNQYESAAFLSAFSGREGVEIVPFTAPADVYVINTCAVTARAAAQSRQLVRRALKGNRRARLVVTGCYAQIAARELLELTDQPLCIVGNDQKERLVEVALADVACDLEMYQADLAACTKAAHLPVTRAGERTRAVLKVQDGCNQFCSYCIVPYARGRSRSVPSAEVLVQAARFLAQGYREMVLTGIHLGHYGLDLAPPQSLLALVEQLLAARHPVRYRLSSLEPTEVSPELLALFAGHPEQLMPHLHIPLQSGDDRILAAMNRHYRGADFAALVNRCLAALPAAAIGVDVLVGFPGEDEAAFNHTLALLVELPVSYLHVFPYSRRPGTTAATLPGQVPEPVKKERVACLRALDQEKRRQFYRRHLGQVRPLLVEEGKQETAGLGHGYTDNYIPVFFALPATVPAPAPNKVVAVRLLEVRDGAVFGRLEKN